MSNTFRYVPGAEIRVKGGGVTEHGLHVSYVRYVPGAEIRGEGRGVVEHETHISYVRYVPGAEIRVKGGGVVEHETHISYVRYVPGAEIRSLKRRRRSEAPVNMALMSVTLDTSQELRSEVK